MKSLFIIAPTGFQNKEYSVPKEILETAEIEVITASKTGGTAKSSSGATVQATHNLSQVQVSDYDAIVFIGGPGAVIYQHDYEAHKIAQDAFNQNKILAAICIAPTILAHAGVLQNKKATVWNGDSQQGKLLQSKGANFTNESVTVDSKIITANGPDAAEEFGKKILRLLTKP